MASTLQLFGLIVQTKSRVFLHNMCHVVMRHVATAEICSFDLVGLSRPDTLPAANLLKGNAQSFYAHASP